MTLSFLSNEILRFYCTNNAAPA